MMMGTSRCGSEVKKSVLSSGRRTGRGLARWLVLIGALCSYCFFVRTGLVSSAAVLLVGALRSLSECLIRDVCEPVCGTTSESACRLGDSVSRIFLPRV